MNIIENIQDETPFTASGFFNVDRSTLTAITGAMLTYLIILIQFDDGNGGKCPSTQPNLTIQQQQFS